MERIPYSEMYFFWFYFNYIWKLVVKYICLPHKLIVDRNHKTCFPNHNSCWVSGVLPLLGLCFVARHMPGSSHWAVLISHDHSIICFSFGKVKNLEIVTWEKSVQIYEVKNEIGIWHHLLFHITILSIKTKGEIGAWMFFENGSILWALENDRE